MTHRHPYKDNKKGGITYSIRDCSRMENTLHMTQRHPYKDNKKGGITYQTQQLEVRDDHV